MHRDINILLIYVSGLMAAHLEGSGSPADLTSWSATGKTQLTCVSDLSCGIAKTSFASLAILLLKFNPFRYPTSEKMVDNVVLVWDLPCKDEL